MKVVRAREVKEMLSTATNHSMSNFNYLKSGTSALIALAMSATAVAPIFPLASASAQPFRTPPTQMRISNQVMIPAGVQIPVKYDEAEKILVTDSETLPLTLTVAANIKDRNGTILIPYNSEIVGQIEPAVEGSQFVAQRLIIEGREIPLDATSRVVATTEIIEEGASTGDILKGTLAGAGAATLIAGVTGDKRIDALEVLAGAAVGTLAGWALPEAGVLGGGSKEVISIDPNRDLTLTLQSDLRIY